jgi:regulator of replication initiation timing
MSETALQGVLARLASDHDGEALTAARMVVKLLAKKGRRPEDLQLGSSDNASEAFQLRAQLAGMASQVAALTAENASLRRMLKERDEAEQEDVRERAYAKVQKPLSNSTPKQEAAYLLDNCEELTQWEKGFLQDIIARDWKRVTDKQRAILDRIAREKL